MAQFDPSVIVVFAILGACAALGIAYAFARFWTFDPAQPDYDRSDSQRQYMQAVRARNRDALWDNAVPARRGGKAREPVVSSG